MLRIVIVLLTAVLRGGTRPRIPEESTPDADLSTSDVKYVAGVRRLRREVAGAVILVYLGSLFVFAALTGLLNRNASWYPDEWDRLDLETGIEGTDALVINLGLATFVAALTIALVQLRPSSTRRSESVVAVVWAEQAAFLVLFAALLSVTLGWTQAFSPAAAHDPGHVCMNLALGMLVTWAAAAVRGWVGLERHLAPLLRRQLKVVEGKLATLRGERRSHSRPTKGGYVFFVLGTAAGSSALLCVVLAYRDVATTADVRWWGMLGLAPVIAAMAWSHVFLAVTSWSAQLGGSLAARVTSAVTRFLGLVVFTVPFVAFAVVEPTLDVKLFWFALAGSAGALPWLLLLLARHTRMRTGQFAVQRTINVGERTAARLRVDLAAIP